MTMTEYKKTLPDAKTILRALWKTFVTLALTAALVFGMNAMMQAFLDDELRSVRESAQKTAEDIAALGEGDQTAALTKRLKLTAQEEFYQKYKNRESYHYYGQFYEMFEQVENADVLFLGTSHTAHGLNPLYIEKENTGHSFFNFALNGSNPQYYLDWYKVFRESGYPTPKMIVFCVDWFMCDDGWLWRRIDFDDSPDKPIAIMRSLRQTEIAAAKAASDTSDEAGAEQTEAAETSGGEKINWWDADAVMTKVFNQIPLIFSRDRIPEMLRWAFGIGEAEQNVPAETSDEASGGDKDGESIYDENGSVIMPEYHHEYLTDAIGNVTSMYYKGFIPWESYYDGSVSEQPCNVTNAEKDAFVALINQFMDDGIQLLFVEVPEYVNGRIAGSAMEENNAWIKKIADRYGIKFLNYNDELYSDINDDYELFSDWGHMNNGGATLFSKKLAQDIKPYLP
ncbi:MAG: hypothetical protein WCQ72_01715 [Eubacteriales bacterium]